MPSARRLNIVSLVGTLLMIVATSACLQAKPKRMIPASSAKELIPESPAKNEDGISKIIIGQLFKSGNTEYERVGAAGLKDAPPLPTGHVVYKDLVFHIQTEAIISAYQLTIFSLPSIERQPDFKRLTILHLEADDLSPSNHSWSEVTVLPGGWDEHLRQFSKDEYERLEPDFNSKRIVSITENFGLFVVALRPESEPDDGPFPKLTLNATSSPEPAKPGEEVTHTITLTNKGTVAAAEVNIREVLDAYLDFVSVTPNQGVCKQKRAANIVVCHLGALPGGATGTVVVVSRVRQELPNENQPTTSISTIDINFKRVSTDFVDERGQILIQPLTSTIVSKKE